MKINSNSRQLKEKQLSQKGKVLWLTGLSGAGKSTLAEALEVELQKLGYLTALLDGDVLRSGLNKDLGFSNEDRAENIRRAAEIAKILVNNGLVVICSFITPTIQIRQMAQEIVGDDYLEVFVKCSFKTCAERDVKGLYKKALSGEIKNFTGLDAPFEEPQQPWLELDTENEDLQFCTQKLLKNLLPLIINPEK